MGRRYYVMTLEVDDTPEVDREGNVSSPGIPVVTSCKRMGFLRKLYHMLRKNKIRAAGMFADEAVLEIPSSVDAHEVFDYRARNGLIGKVRKQRKLAQEDPVEF